MKVAYHVTFGMQGFMIITLSYKPLHLQVTLCLICDSASYVEHLEQGISSYRDGNVPGKRHFKGSMQQILYKCMQLKSRVSAHAGQNCVKRPWVLTWSITVSTKTKATK